MGGVVVDTGGGREGEGAMTQTVDERIRRQYNDIHDWPEAGTAANLWLLAKVWRQRANPDDDAMMRTYTAEAQETYEECAEALETVLRAATTDHWGV